MMDPGEMEAGWKRPELCRICECPAVDGSVRVDQLDGRKLSLWWKNKLDTDFHPNENQLICQFCVWQAR
jgi:hypothetical protein